MAREPLQPGDLRDYADYEAERTRVGGRLATRLSREIDPQARPRRSPMRLLYVTFPLAAAALVGVAVVSSLTGPPTPVEVTHIAPAALPEAPPPRTVAVSDGLTVRTSLDQTAMLQNTGEDRFLVVEFVADGVAARQPVHVSAVVDTSGSMGGDNKMEFARTALLELAGQLGPEDTLSLVGFDDAATVWLPATAMSDRRRAFEAIASLRPGGGTRIGAGLTEGLAQLRRVERPGARRVVLLSDGLSGEDPAALASLAGSQIESGITVSALGLGLDFDSRALVAISDAGGGRYSYVDRAERVSAMFAEELGTLTRIAARGVALQVVLAEGVQVRSVYGYEENDGSIDSLGYRAFVGDMHGLQERKVVARLRVPDDVPGDRPVASVVVHYTDPGSGERRTVDLAVTATVTTDPAVAVASIEPHAGLLAARAVQGATLERGRNGWASGNEASALEAFGEGDRMLSALEGRFGNEVGELRKSLKARVEEHENLEALSNLGYIDAGAERTLDLEAGYEALGAME